MWCINWHIKGKNHIVYIYHVQYSISCTWVVFVILQVIIPEDCFWPPLLHYHTTPTPLTHTPPPIPPPPPSWLYGWGLLNSGVWINYKSQSWYWWMPEIERLPLSNNSMENFFFKISYLLCSQWLLESSLWVFLFETLLEFDLTKSTSSPLDLCSDSCFLF